MKDYLKLIFLNIINNIDFSDNRDIKDIKDIIAYDFKYIYISILLAIIISLLLFFILRKKKNNIQKEEKPVLAPEAAALDKINKLRESKLIGQGRHKEFYTILSDIIRIFLEDKYKISATDQTTYELICEIKSKNIISGKAAIIQDFLSDCDMVKFAKHIPSKEDSDGMLNIAVEIINIAENEHTEDQPEIKANV